MQQMQALVQNPRPEGRVGVLMPDREIRYPATEPAASLASDAIPGRLSLLIITRGLPGAGKTFAALRWVAEDPEHRARVGSDQIAAMLHPHALDGDGVSYGPVYAQREQLVVNAAIAALLKAGIDVVCDDPFLLPQYLDAVRELAGTCGADLVIWDLTDVSIDECIARDRQRGQTGGHTVGEHTIRAQHQLHRQHQLLSAADTTAATNDSLPTPDRSLPVRVVFGEVQGTCQ
jgi:predicted kinase